MPGLAGFAEHSTMIWDPIQMPKCAKSHLLMVWLDLTNAYTSVPHQLSCFTLNFFHIPWQPEVLKKANTTFLQTTSCSSMFLKRLEKVLTKAQMEFNAEYLQRGAIPLLVVQPTISTAQFYINSTLQSRIEQPEAVSQASGDCWMDTHRTGLGSGWAQALGHVPEPLKWRWRNWWCLRLPGQGKSTLRSQLTANTTKEGGVLRKMCPTEP